MTRHHDLDRGPSHRTAPTPPASEADRGDNPTAPATAPARNNDKHLRWLDKAEHWGEWRRFSETELAEPESIWMLSGPTGRVRFYAIGKGQVGDEHNSVVAAAYWAWANRWLWCDPWGQIDMLAQLACRQWVLDGGARREAVTA